MQLSKLLKSIQVYFNHFKSKVITQSRRIWHAHKLHKLMTKQYNKTSKTKQQRETMCNCHKFLLNWCYKVKLIRSDATWYQTKKVHSA